jgi:putative spermidine/putrescine transport system substrate-binding protein
MKSLLKIRALALCAGALVLVAACGPPSGGGTATTPAGSAKSAADVGGLSALVTAAKKEGALNVIALPPDWANYGAVINGFKAKYSGITVTSANPDGSSQDEVNAVNQLAGTDRAPDVLDIGRKVTLANTSLFAPYQVLTWKDIPDNQKEPTGLYVQDYGGYMSIGYDSAKFGTISSIQDLLGSKFKSSVALNGDPTKANAALNGVMMASLANGGSLDNIGPGVDFFQKLNKAGTFSPVQATTATVKNGSTPVVFDWDYLSASHGTDVPTWKIYVPDNALLLDFYNQAISKQAPHPAAARLWEEYLYSDEGQNLWLKGKARPVRMAAMQASGKIDAAAAAALPKVSDPKKAVFMSDSQATAAGAYLTAHWAAAIGA